MSTHLNAIKTEMIVLSTVKVWNGVTASCLVKVKLPLHAPWKCEGGGAYCLYPHAFVTPAIDGNDWLSSPSGYFIPGKGTRRIPWTLMLVDYTDDLDNSVIQPMSFPSRESNLDYLACNWVTILVSCLFKWPWTVLVCALCSSSVWM